MKNGDISNDLPKRVLVVTDVFVTKEVTSKKVFKFLSVPKVKYNVNRQLLSNFYLYTTRQGVTLELVSFDFDEEGLPQLMERLDSIGTNPFRYFSSYESVNHLVNELPYRPEVVGVMDIPARQLRYGHWGMDRL
jgi:hypothetical protein